MNLFSVLHRAFRLLFSTTAAILFVVGISFASYSSPAIAGLDPFIGEIEILPYTFCPQGFLEANGQIISISQNTALFSLLGTTYGGNGTTTFGLPDLSGRFPIGAGNGAGLPSVLLGQKSGSVSISLTTNNLPPHNHSYATNTVTAVAGTAESGAAVNVVQSITPTTGTANTSATGGGAPVSIMPPYVAVKYCIATQGIYPSRP